MNIINKFRGYKGEMVKNTDLTRWRGESPHEPPIIDEPPPRTEEPPSENTEEEGGGEDSEPVEVEQPKEGDFKDIEDLIKETNTQVKKKVESNIDAWKDDPKFSPMGGLDAVGGVNVEFNLGSKSSWRRILMKRISEALKTMIVWEEGPHRRFPKVPEREGSKRTIGTIVFCIDNSGSFVSMKAGVQQASSLVDCPAFGKVLREIATLMNSSPCFKASPITALMYYWGGSTTGSVEHTKIPPGHTKSVTGFVGAIKSSAPKTLANGTDVVPMLSILKDKLRANKNADLILFFTDGFIFDLDGVKDAVEKKEVKKEMLTRIEAELAQIGSFIRGMKAKLVWVIIAESESQAQMNLKYAITKIDPAAVTRAVFVSLSGAD